jgi:predicted ArsR family transcriptional regulator
LASRLKHRQATQNRLVALQHPTRTAIFRILTERTASVGEMAKELGMGSQEMTNIRHHLRVLINLGCAEHVGERRVGRHVVAVYKATERALIDTDEWEQIVAESPELADYLLGEIIQVQIDDFVAALKHKTLGGDDQFHITHTSRVLDEEGLVKMMEIYEGCRLQADEVEREAAERRAEDGTDALHVSANLALFKIPKPGT